MEGKKAMPQVQREGGEIEHSIWFKKKKKTQQTEKPEAKAACPKIDLWVFLAS